jgi:two-component system, NarL family, response regulator DevR
MSEAIRVLIADDHPLIRSGLCLALQTEPDIVVAGEASDGDEAQRQCEGLQPDVLVLDLNMDGPPAVATLASVRERCPRTRVLILTAYDDDIYVRSLVLAGAMGYVLKDEAPKALVQAVRTVAHGGTWFSRPVVENLVLRGEHDERDSPPLTERERQIIRLIAQGWDNARIAGALCLSEQTIRNYVSRLYGKIGVQTRAEAVVWGRDHGMTA